MSGKSFEDRDEEVREQMNENDMSVHDAYAKDVFEDGLSAVDMSGGRRGGRIILPNERLAVLWRKMFRVQFTDGAWRDTESNFQMEHPFAYSDAEIIVDGSRTAPQFESYETHEKMETPLNHFDSVPMFYEDMIYIIRMMTGNDDYGMSELKSDLRTFDNIDFDVADVDNCSRCNPDIY